MPLLSLWKSNPEAVLQFNIEQVVATAGDGKLKDFSVCSQELHTYLTQVPSDKLGEYAEHCLVDSFNKSGLVLQDVVNELGRRLDYQVENGRYQGVVGGIGYDGIWTSPESSDIVVEVKTTDAYRISLDTIATYRNKLTASGKLQGAASILIIVGRGETGELEAQVRGSRHAWDMRLISVDALVKLVELKEATEAGVTGAKIRSILVPMEFTRLDTLVDVLFTAAKDVETTVESEAPVTAEADEAVTSASSSPQFTDQQVLAERRGRILASLDQRDETKLVKRSRALYWDASHTYRVACTISKRYDKKGASAYWYAYHPNWDAFLKAGETSYLALGCIDMDVSFVLPLAVIQNHLPELGTTNKEDIVQYWHLKIFEHNPGFFTLQLPKSGNQLSLKEFTVPVT